MDANEILKQTIKILFVEDIISDYELAVHEISKEGITFNSIRVQTQEEFLKGLNEFKPDIIISDYMLPVFDGLTALHLTLEHTSNTPFIVLTGSMNEATAVNCMKKGASDYVIKEHITRLPHAIIEALQRKETIIAKELAEIELKESEERFRHLFDTSPDAMFLIDPYSVDVLHKIVDCNESACKMNGYTKSELIGKTIDTLNLLPGTKENNIAYFNKIKENRVLKYETMHRHKDGHIFPVEVMTSILLVKGRELILGVDRDITERKIAEQKVLKLNRTYLVLSNINKLIVREHDSQKIFEEVCNIAIENGELRMCWVGLLDKATGNIQPVAKAGYVGDYFDNVSFSVLDTPEEKGPISKVVREGKHIICNDMENYPGIIPWREKARELGYKSIGAFPLKMFSECIGSIIFYSSETNYFDDDEITLLEELAMDISYAIESLEIEKKQKITEDALTKERYLMNLLMDNIPDHIYFKDLNSRFIRMNKSQAERFGLNNPAEAIGKSDFSFFSEEHAQQAFNDEQEIIRTGIPIINFEEKETWPDGHISWVFTTKEPMRDQSGKIIGTFGVSRDITDKKRIEEQMRKLSMGIEQSPLCIVITDKDANIEYVNPKFTEITGYSLLEVIGKNPRVLQSGKIQKEEYEKMWQTLISGKVWKGEFNNKKKDGELYWESATISPIIDSKGNITHYIALKQDITKQKAVEESVKQFNHIVEESLNEIYIFEQETLKFLYANHAALQNIGFTLDELKRLTPIDIKPDFNYVQFKKLLYPLSGNKKQNISFQTRHKRKNNTYYPVEVHMQSAVYDSKIVFVAFILDITEKQKLQNQLIQTQKVQSIGTLAGGIAHDFNNILGIILAFTSILEKSKGDLEKISKSVSAITQAVSRGSALTRQILTFARQTSLSIGAMSIPALVRELLVMLKETFPPTIEFQTEIEKDIPLINADNSQMHQVMLNLCVNARDAMPKGGIIKIKVNVIQLEELIHQFSTAENQQYVCISVMDNGIGIDENIKSRLFDPFFTTKEMGKGTGLGLSVVYGVIQEHSGFISFDSELGKGSTFRLYLPVPEEYKIYNEVTSAKERETITGSETILFVEDEELLREVVQSTLESHGYKVLTAVDGKEAVEIYKKHLTEIDLVITDMGLPKMNGIDEFILLKEMNPKVKLIFASGFIALESRSELLKSGAKGFIQKPYVMNEVLHMIREVLDEK